MRRKMKVTRIRKRWIWASALLLVIVFLVVWFDQSLQPALRHVATVKLKQIATQAINRAITEQVAQSTPFEELVEWKTGADGEFVGAVFNQQAHARMTAACIQVVEQTLANMEKVPEHVPIGMVMDSSLLSVLGPKLQLTLSPSGIVSAEMGSEWKEAGINTMMLEIYVTIKTEIKVLVGFDAAHAEVETRIPLTYAVFNGKVPNYYLNQRTSSGAVLPPRIPFEVP